MHTVMEQPEYEELIDLVETMSEYNLKELGLLIQRRLTVLAQQQEAADEARVVEESRQSPLERALARSEATDAAHVRANREALLEHARMGRDICTLDKDGKVIWIPPAEIFARYGFDEFGRPLPVSTPAPQ